EIARLANEEGVSPEALGVTPADVVEIEQLIADKTINDKIARQIVGYIAAGEGRPGEIVEARSLAVVSDDSALTSAVDEAMAANPDVVRRVNDGHMKAVGPLIGPVMKATKGQADAGRVREIILEKINKPASSSRSGQCGCTALIVCGVAPCRVRKDRTCSLLVEELQACPWEENCPDEATR